MVKKIEVRHADDLSFHVRYGIFDGEKMIIGTSSKVPPDTLHDLSMLLTNSDTLIREFKSMFEKLWAVSISFEDRLNSIKNK
ncbi:MAG: hypothetical protein QXX95_00830 [Nitrososphaerales archaeon]